MTAIFDYNYLDRESLNSLEAANFSVKGSKRLCFHKDEKAGLHAMLINLKPDMPTSISGSIKNS